MRAWQEYERDPNYPQIQAKKDRKGTRVVSRYTMQKYQHPLQQMLKAQSNPLSHVITERSSTIFFFEKFSHDVNFNTLVF